MATKAEIEAKASELQKGGKPYNVAYDEAVRLLGQPTDDDSSEDKGGVIGTVTGGLQKLGEAAKGAWNSYQNTYNHNTINHTSPTTGSKGAGQKESEAMKNAMPKSEHLNYDKKQLEQFVRNMAKNSKGDREAFIKSIRASAKAFGLTEDEIVDYATKGGFWSDKDIFNEENPVTEVGKEEEETEGNGSTGEGTGGSSGGGGGNNTTEEKKVPQRYYSVWDAYWKGAFGEPGSREAKGAAAYYTVDAIANYFKNLSKGIGNIGAQFSGGTVDTSDDKPSEWQKAMNVMNEEQREKWGEQQGSQRSRNAKAQNADINTKQLSNRILSNRAAVMDFAHDMFKAATNKAEKMYWADIMNGRNDAVGAIGNATALDLYNMMYDTVYGNKK